MAFCDELMRVSQAIWEREREHPFVRGLGDGSLDAQRFRFYLEQDYLFLIEYAKVFALAATRAAELETMATFAQLCADTLNTEMALHRSYCAEFGIAPEALEAAEPAQTTAGYTGHLLQVAATGGVAEICAAVLPCQWGYSEIARHLQAQGLPAEARYRKWIEMYASPEFEAYGAWLRGRLEALAPGFPPAQVARLKRVFHTSSRWEYLFWEMAWRMERWAVPE
jgi:thiaminase (transcriptional activator TenA)